MNDFASIAGAEHITQEAGILTVAPASTQETAAIVQACCEQKLVVSPRGGGTKLDWGNAVEPQLVLDTRRLTGVREHSWQDMTATVGAGTTWAELQSTLAQHRQRVALDPLFPALATVGGIIAVNDSGSLRMRYGSLRDLVIGMTIVLADGTIARSGGKVVKNVAGYDLPKLLTGSFGTLGIVTEVTFRLHPLQPHSETWTVLSPDVSILAELQQKLLGAAMSVESLQMRSNDEGFALDVRFASLPEVLREHERRLRELCEPLAPSSSSDKIWQARERLFDVADAAVLKLTALPSKIGAILEGFRSLVSTDVRTVCVADATGILTVALNAPPAHTAAIIEDLRARLRSDGSTVVVLRAANLEPENLDRWGGSSPAIAVMRAIKQQFDPERLLNPGRFVGGI
jgi:glycolate oxidase FAD binding subunit